MMTFEGAGFEITPLDLNGAVLSMTILNKSDWMEVLVDVHSRLVLVNLGCALNEI